MNRTEVLDKVGGLLSIPNTELATTKQVAEYYGVEVSLIHRTLGESREEISGSGVNSIDYHEIKKDYLNSGGKRKSWREYCWEYGISSNSNTYSKTAVLLIGFLLEDSPKAEEVRRLVMKTNGAVITPVIVEETPTINVAKDEMVVVQNNQAVTTSLQVAESFGKEHRNVIRDIETLKKDVLNFEQMFQEGDIPDNYGRPRRAYFMNRDGFTLLAMGFTGKKALQFKLKYIEQFNLMENQMKSQVVVASYMIDDPIKRAEQWISEQRNKVLLEETIEKQTEAITHKQDVIEGLTDNISLADKHLASL